jgi:hypothetical protein
VFGGTLAGWRSLLTVHGASIMAARPLLVADLSDLSGQYAAGESILPANTSRSDTTSGDGPYASRSRIPGEPE